MSLTNTEQLTLQNKLIQKGKYEVEKAEVEKEVKRFTETRDLVKKQFELQTLNDEAAVSPKLYKLLKPTWEFENDPEYMERHRQITIIGHKLKVAQFEAALANHNLNIENANKRLTDVTASIEKISKEISELEKKGE